MLAGTSRALPNPPGINLEVYYMVIDVLILLGLLGIYLKVHESAGKLGFMGFLPAVIGTAIIAGPGDKIGDFDVYVLGATMISIGLSIFGLAVFKLGRLFQIAAILWIVSCLVGIGGFALGTPETFTIAGVTFGLGLIAAGYAAQKS